MGPLAHCQRQEECNVSSPTHSHAGAWLVMATILVVDDDDTVRIAILHMLECMGHRVLECADGIEALGVLTECTPDVVILDMHMPRMNGLEFQQALRKAGQPSP